MNDYSSSAIPKSVQSTPSHKAVEVLRKIFTIYGTRERKEDNKSEAPKVFTIYHCDDNKKPIELLARLTGDTLALAENYEREAAIRIQNVFAGNAPPMQFPLKKSSTETQWPERRNKAILNTASPIDPSKLDETAREIMNGYSHALGLQVAIMSLHPRTRMELIDPKAMLKKERGEALVKLYLNCLVRSAREKLEAFGLSTLDAMSLNGALIRYSVQTNLLITGKPYGIEPMVGKVSTPEKLDHAIETINDYGSDRTAELFILHKELKKMER